MTSEPSAELVPHKISAGEIKPGDLVARFRRGPYYTALWVVPSFNTVRLRFDQIPDASPPKLAVWWVLR